MVERNNKSEVNEQKQPDTRQNEKPSEKPTEWLIEGLIPKGACVLMEIVD